MQDKLIMFPKTTQYDQMLEVLDYLHSAASDHNHRSVTNMTDEDLISLLQDIAYTAQETITEIRSEQENTQAFLQIVK